MTGSKFVTLYEALQRFDDRAAQSRITCPRLCFAGSADRIDYGPRWGNTQVDIAGPILEHRAELEGLGWDVRVLDGLDHMRAMQPDQVLPVIRPWLASKLSALSN
ncbi:alpha/beta fold hydrolase [Planotetraspora sp. GP83]|uniref:alpha/beta fold hydrolase n=1 Tax=Planotetraspora sp. GP83 TaxID=3156264 RepID=UPI0035162123